MNLQPLSDASILKLYDSIREHVVADLRTGSPHRLLGRAAKERAETLEAELTRRGIPFDSIEWP